MQDDIKHRKQQNAQKLPKDMNKRISSRNCEIAQISTGLCVHVCSCLNVPCHNMTMSE
jgi:hypothetical protein